MARYQFTSPVELEGRGCGVEPELHNPSTQRRSFFAARYALSPQTFGMKVRIGIWGSAAVAAGKRIRSQEDTNVLEQTEWTVPQEA